MLEGRNNNGIQILNEIINNFSPDKFVRFFREKNRSFAPRTEALSQYDDALFRNGIKLGEIQFAQDEKMLICAFEATQPLSERSGKKAQYEKGKKILKESQSDAGIFIFYNPQGNFRFSLIYANYLGKKRDWSAFRRFTYFVSPSETNKTFLKQIGEGDFSSLEKIKGAFSVEKVTKEFYAEIANWYFWTMNKVQFPKDFKYSADPQKDDELRNAINLIRLITRIIFIWFIRQKGIIPDALFDKNLQKSMVKDFCRDNKSANYYNAILQNLFFGTLNQKMDERGFVKEGSFHENINEYGVKNLFRYADKFTINEDEVIGLFKDIPFLNGGLFDCLDKPDEQGKTIYVDGFSRNTSKQARIPDYLFFQENEISVDLSSLGLGRNQKVKGLFEILNNYNFTIDENTPVDLEIALDPELLGKVFENLLASYNPETQTTARKQTGSFYTPREIVNYMVDESLIAYLANAIERHSRETDSDVTPPPSAPPLRHLISYTDEPHQFTQSEVDALINAIDNAKILDPACGSGAFPMGILHKLVHILHKLDPKNEQWKKRQIEKAKLIDDPNIRQNAINDIEAAFESNELDYGRKLYLIENSIYGVDIQSIAVQIAKLRFFISLIIDEKKQPGRENLGIRSLPNLETKFVAANTLIGLDKPHGQQSFRNPEIERLEKELKQLRHEYFNAKTRKEKLQCQKQDKKLRQDIAGLLVKDGWNDTTAKQIVKFDPYDQNASADFFDPEWMFGIKNPSPLVGEHASSIPSPLVGEGKGEGGFDVVIANPPYIRAEELGNLKTYLKAAYSIFASAGDIFSYFYEKSFNILKNEGVFCFINNAFDKTTAGKTLREYIAENCSLKKYIDFKSVGVFEGTTTYPIILLATKSKPHDTFEYLKVTEDILSRFNFGGEIVYAPLPRSALKQLSWSFDNQEHAVLAEKISKHKKLREVFGKCYYGVKTALNDAFITEKKLGNSKHLKPVFEGKDIKKWLTPAIDKKMIVFENKSTRAVYNGQDEAKAFKAMQATFPAIMKNLEPFAEAARKRYDKGEFWWELRNCAYYELFAKPKIIFPNLQNANKFAYDISGTYLNAPAVFLPTEVKWLLGLLNSKVVWHFLKTICVVRSGGFIEVKPQYFEQIPISPIKDPDKKKIDALVDQILAAKKKDPSADTSALERQIDKMVYELYNLTPEEIAIVEGKR